MKEQTENNKTLIACATIVLAAIGLFLGIRFRHPILQTFSAGTWIAFISFLLSLGSVKDHHSNLLPMVAFFFSFISMSATVFVNTL